MVLGKAVSLLIFGKCSQWSNNAAKGFACVKVWCTQGGMPASIKPGPPWINPSAVQRCNNSVFFTAAVPKAGLMCAIIPNAG